MVSRQAPPCIMLLITGRGGWQAQVPQRLMPQRPMELDEGEVEDLLGGGDRFQGLGQGQNSSRRGGRGYSART